jgi:hypothetical protein
MKGEDAPISSSRVKYSRVERWVDQQLPKPPSRPKLNHRLGLSRLALHNEIEICLPEVDVADLSESWTRDPIDEDAVGVIVTVGAAY